MDRHHIHELQTLNGPVSFVAHPIQSTAVRTFHLAVLVICYRNNTMADKLKNYNFKLKKGLEVQEIIK